MTKWWIEFFGYFDNLFTSNGGVITDILLVKIGIERTILGDGNLVSVVLVTLKVGVIWKLKYFYGNNWYMIIQSILLWILTRFRRTYFYHLRPHTKQMISGSFWNIQQVDTSTISRSICPRWRIYILDEKTDVSSSKE